MIIYAVFSHTPNCITFVEAFSSEKQAEKFVKETLTDLKESSIMRIVTLDASKSLESKAYILKDGRPVII